MLMIVQFEDATNGLWPMRRHGQCMTCKARVACEEVRWGLLTLSHRGTRTVLLIDSDDGCRVDDGVRL